jgi:hypothetical protein
MGFADLQETELMVVATTVTLSVCRTALLETIPEGLLRLSGFVSSTKGAQP